jgi:hypothetical protein
MIRTAPFGDKKDPKGSNGQAPSDPTPDTQNGSGLDSQPQLMH